MKISISQTDKATIAPFAAAIQFDDGPGHPVTINDPFTVEEEARLEWYYEEWLRFPFTGKVKASHAAASTQSYGENLFQQLFTGDALVEYKMGLRYEGGLSQMSFEIRGTPAFHGLHWEALKAPDARPFAVECPFLRQNNTPPPIHIRPQASPVLNILLVTARPGGRRDVGYRTISRPLVEAVKNAKLRTRIDIVRPGSYKALVNHLEESRDRHGDGFYHVIHFDLHGSLLEYAQYQAIDADAAPDRHLYKRVWTGEH